VHVDIVSRTFSGGETYPSSCNAHAKPIELKVNVAQTRGWPRIA